MARDGIETDETRWPIVVHRTIGIPSEDDVDRFIDAANAHLQRQEPYVVVFDNTHAGRVPAYMRQRASDWLRENAPRLSRYCLGTALVFKGAALRFVMTGVMLVASHPVPHEVCGTEQEALRWASERLRSAISRGAFG
ncbi:MAG: hypothetical protein AB7S26_41425 [Sandaracinaceae bacterium]